MKKLLLILLVLLAMGGIGFAAGWLLMPRQAKSSAATHEPMLYKMPLGRITIQVLQPKRILHVQIDMDVFIADATNFERLGDAEGRARLRDATIGAVSDLAETLLWVDPGQEDTLDQQALAEQIVMKLNSSFPSVRSARLNSFVAHPTPRN